MRYRFALAISIYVRQESLIHPVAWNGEREGPGNSLLAKGVMRRSALATPTELVQQFAACVEGTNMIATKMDAQTNPLLKSQMVDMTGPGRPQVKG